MKRVIVALIVIISSTIFSCKMGKYCLEEEPSFDLKIYFKNSGIFSLDTNAIYVRERNRVKNNNELEKFYNFSRYWSDGRCYTSSSLNHFPTLADIYAADTMAKDYYKIEENILIEEYASHDFHTRAVGYWKMTDNGDLQMVSGHSRSIIRCNIKSASEIESIANNFGNVYKKFVFR